MIVEIVTFQNGKSVFRGYKSCDGQFYW